MTYFSHTAAADRYAAARPYFHPLVVDLIRRLCQLETCDAALDVGCGTGQSTVPLAELAQQVVGVDISPAMLARAMAHPRVQYLQAPAEALPLEASSFDLLTVGLAFHWLDRGRFLREAHRVLRPAGWLVLYNDWFCGHMNENARFEEWFRASYLQRYPSPLRNSQPLTDDELGAKGFGPMMGEKFSHEIAMSPESLADYLLTQSNVIAAVELGQESADDVRNWLLNQLATILPASTGTFAFAGELQACRKRA